MTIETDLPTFALSPRAPPKNDREQVMKCYCEPCDHSWTGFLPTGVHEPVWRAAYHAMQCPVCGGTYADGKVRVENVF